MFQILSVVNIVVIYQPAQEIGFGIHELKQIGVIYTAYSTSVLIVATILIGYIIGERFPYRTYAIFCVLSSILYAFSAAILTYQCVHLRDPIFHPSEQNMQLLVGSVVASIVNCVVLAADGLLTVVKTEPF